jgi:hypothetical protein
MTLDDLPDFPSADDLACFGFSPEDVARRCPHAVWYGTANASYWDCNDLEPLTREEEGGDEP